MRPALLQRGIESVFGSVSSTDPVVRRLTPIALLNTFGNGMFFTTSALYFTRFAGVTVAQLGFGLTVAALGAIALSAPVGRLADRVGARNLVWPLWLAETCGVLGYTLVHGFAAFLIMVCVVIAIDRSALVGFRAFLATGLTATSRVEARAYIRALSNLGTALGAAIGAAALQLDSAAAYRSVLVVDALTFAISAALFTRLPAAARQSRGADTGPPVATGAATEPATSRPARVSRNRPYLVLVVLAAVLTMNAALFEVGLPLWIVGHTRAPAWVVAAVLFTNTLLVAGLQVRLSRGSSEVPDAARACRRAGGLVALACLGYGAAHWCPVLLATVVLLVAVVVHTLAEIWFSAGSTTLSFELAPAEFAGAYQGMFQTGFATGLLLAPVVVTSTALRWEFPGWALLAAAFAGAGALFVPVTRWAAGTNQRPAAGRLDQVARS